jgi:outer membrane lipoprotein SlyB
MKRSLSLVLVTVAGLGLAACAGGPRSDVYNGGSTQRASQVERGTVLQVRPVRIEDGKSSLGTLVGAGAGGVAGSAIGGGMRANVLGAIGGAVVGGLLGNVVDDQLSNSNGFEYIIQTESGRTLSVAQADDRPFTAGDRVMLVMGPPARLIADTSPPPPPPSPPVRP